MKLIFATELKDAKKLSKLLQEAGFEPSYSESGMMAIFEFYGDLTTLLKIHGELQFEKGLNQRRY
jgi:hypothetical protein